MERVLHSSNIKLGEISAKALKEITLQRWDLPMNFESLYPPEVGSAQRLAPKNLNGFRQIHLV